MREYLTLSLKQKRGTGLTVHVTRLIIIHVEIEAPVNTRWTQREKKLTKPTHTNTQTRRHT